MNERDVKRVPFQDHGDGREGRSSNSSLIERSGEVEKGREEGEREREKMKIIILSLSLRARARPLYVCMYSIS